MKMSFESKQVDDDQDLEVERYYLSPLLLVVWDGVRIVSRISALDPLAQKHKSTDKSEPDQYHSDS